MNKIWEGADALSKFLIPIDELLPSAKNPRRGHVEAIATSLQRFGQTRPILIDSRRIIAGHHVRLAALELGWTHLAALEHNFPDQTEADAYLIADNRTHDLGSYELAELAQHLEALAELDKLDGTGYSLDDLDDMLARLQKQSERKSDPPPPPPAPEMVEMVLVFSPDRRDQLDIWMNIVQKERGVEGPSDAVYEAMEIAANQLNA